MVFILLRRLCPGDPPEADELLDYFDSTYISGRLRQQKPAQNQAVRLVLRRSPPMFPPAIWNVHDATVNIWRVIEWCQKEEATVRTIIQQDAVGYPPVKRNQQRHVQPQERLQNLCRDLTTGQKTIAEFLCGVGWNIRLNHQH